MLKTIFLEEDRWFLYENGDCVCENSDCYNVFTKKKNIKVIPQNIINELEKHFEKNK